MAVSTQDQLKKLARAPLHVKLGILVGLLVLMIAVYWFMFYADATEELTQARASTTRLAQEEETLQQRKKQYLDLLQEKLELEKELRDNSVMLPTTAELASFLVHLQSQALAANVNVETLRRENEVPVENFVKVPVAMKITGTFYEINEYFKLLYETPRIITVEALDVSQPKLTGDQIMLTASFRASTFRQADEPAAARTP